MENHRAEEEILTVKGLSVSFTQYDRGFGRLIGMPKTKMTKCLNGNSKEKVLLLLLVL